MKAAYKSLIPIILIFILSNEGITQTKFEREYGINKTEAPKKAVDFIDSCNFSKKINWYAEESQDGKTFEAKTKHRNHKFSIEFDNYGVLLDVEQKVDFDELDESVKTSISKTIGDLFTTYKVRKTQIQWTGKSKGLMDLIKNGRSDKPYTTQYEIIVDARKDGFSSYYEVLLDSSGNPLEVLEIKQPNADNLVF
ncbi:MAG: hypothetical protein JW731_10160 [Bacteroidales bacterium]|nr:hypothetical protein [Bacteroidales bacterium]